VAPYGIAPTTCQIPDVYKSQTKHAQATVAMSTPTENDQPTKKRKVLRRKEGEVAPTDEWGSESTSDDTWTPPSSEEEEEGDSMVATVAPSTRQLRSRGPVPRLVADEVNPIMDKADEEVNNESDFSTTTDEDEEEEDEEEEDDDDDDEEDDDESDTEEDGYSDDDSFVTSDEEEDDDADDEEEVPVPDPNAPSLDPITTDELLANFGPPEEPSGPA